jgi:CRP/FNR family transcriptional regulator, cyclic AMP receptor protein
MPALSASDDLCLERLAAYLRPRSARAGAVLVSHHGPSESLYLLVEGRARLCLVSSDGRELTISHLEAPAQFGDFGLVEWTPATADCVAVTDVELLVLDRSDLEHAIEADPSFAIEIIGGLSLRLRDTVRQLEALAFHDAGHRVMRVLFDLADSSREKRGTSVVTGLTHYEIATLAGTSRETASRVISRLSRDGVVVTRDRRIVVDLQKLERRLRDS